MRDFMIDVARKAGALLMDYYRRDIHVGHKEIAIDLVTEADYASEQLIIDAINAQYPDHDIMAEETAAFRRDAECLWIIDPLDGTVNYAHHYPMFCVSIAFQCHGIVSLGVTYDPTRDELFWAKVDEGAYLNDQRLHVSTAARLEQAVVATGFPYRRAEITDNNLREFSQVMPRVQGIRRAGSAALDMAYVAVGRLDGYWEFHLQPWDWAAGQLLVSEAGGVVTTSAGRAWSMDADSAVVGNESIHAALLDIIGNDYFNHEGHEEVPR